MDFDVVSIAQHAALLAGAYALLWLWHRHGRFILKWTAVILFCWGAYSWAFLALVIWCFAKNAHCQVMAELRAGGFYNGPWFD